MTNNNFPYYYRTGQEICLGDYVFQCGHYGYIERIWEPNSHGAIQAEMPGGAFMVYAINTGGLTVMEFDHPDVLGSEHADCGLEFKSRATLWFHVHYSWRHFKYVASAFYRTRIMSSAWRGYTYFHFKEFLMTLVELLQAIVFGPGKNVRQMAEM